MSSRLQLDLAWLVDAEPLMANTYWTQRGTQGASLAGMRAVEGQGAEPIRQVGRWFERVHLAAMRSTAGIEVLAANTPLRTTGRTIGELDVLYRRAGMVVHREVAVKFYLAAKPGGKPSAWIGPGKRDRLDLKLDRLTTHQCAVASEARALGAWPEELPFPDITEVLLLGALFSPADDQRLPRGANARADHGRWYYASDFVDRFADDPWCDLDKPWWLSPAHAREATMISARRLAAGLRRPRFVARVSTEVERAFVVPDRWWSDLGMP
ncbi:MAG: DUF1853 family protein [Nannocystaceae bacterium]|nr:DUF1853 family protein [Nannocystaceae bacterium]